MDTLSNVCNVWTIDQLADANELLDLQAEAQARALARTREGGRR